MEDAASITVAVGTLVVAILVYLHEKGKQRDAWLQAYTSVYEAFWNDGEMREVRSWIANEDAFSKVQGVIERRKELDEDPEAGDSLSADEYLVIDKLDRFFSLMARMVLVEREFRHDANLWGIGLWKFWLSAAYSRAEFNWYMAAYWVELAKYCDHAYGPTHRNPIRGLRGEGTE